MNTDYGQNDGDSTYKLKVESKKQFLRFLDEPLDSSRWKREGVYGSWTIGPKGIKITYNLNIFEPYSTILLNIDHD